MSLFRGIGFAAVCLIGLNTQSLFGAYGGSYDNCVEHLIWNENEDPRFAEELCEELCPYNTHSCVSREEYEYYENCEWDKEVDRKDREDQEGGEDDSEGDDFEDDECE